MRRLLSPSVAILLVACSETTAPTIPAGSLRADRSPPAVTTARAAVPVEVTVRNETSAWSVDVLGRLPRFQAQSWEVEIGSPPRVVATAQETAPLPAGETRTILVTVPSVRHMKAWLRASVVSQPAGPSGARAHFLGCRPKALQRRDGAWTVEFRIRQVESRSRFVVRCS